MLFQMLFPELKNSQYFFSYGPSKMTSSMHFLWRAGTKIAKKDYFMQNATPPTILKLSMSNFNTTFLNILRRHQQSPIFEFVKKNFLGLKMSQFLPIFGHKFLLGNKFKNRLLRMPAQYIQEGCVKILHW